MGSCAPCAQEKNTILDKRQFFCRNQNILTWNEGDDVSKSKISASGKSGLLHSVFACGNTVSEQGFSVVTENRAQLSEIFVTSLRYVKDVSKHKGDI